MKLVNLEKNKRCFILANGPSINNYDFSKLSKEIVIGMNASTLLTKEYNFHQKYYVLSDARFLQVDTKRPLAIKELNPNTIRVLRKELATYDEPLPNKTFYVKSIGRDGFSFNIHKGFYFGCTTTLLAIQLAATLGCSKIYLMGLDLTNYFSDNIRFYQESKAQEYDLFIGTQIYNIANAYQCLHDRGIELYNCNPNSLISPYLPFANYLELFN